VKIEILRIPFTLSPPAPPSPPQYLGRILDTIYDFTMKIETSRHLFLILYICTMRQILNVQGPVYVPAAFNYMQPVYYVLLRRLRLLERRDYDTAYCCVGIIKRGGQFAFVFPMWKENVPAHDSLDMRILRQ